MASSTEAASTVARRASHVNRIWSALCRALRRDAISSRAFPQATHDVRHFYGGHRGVEAFVARFTTRPIHRLIERIARKYSERHGHPGFRTHLRNSLCCFAGDVIKVRCVASNHRPDANNRVVALLSRELARRHRYFPRARDFYNFDIGFGAAGPRERVKCACEQPITDKVVEFGRYDGEREALRNQLSFDYFRHRRLYSISFRTR